MLLTLTNAEGHWSQKRSLGGMVRERLSRDNFKSHSTTKSTHNLQRGSSKSTRETTTLCVFQPLS